MTPYSLCMQARHWWRGGIQCPNIVATHAYTSMDNDSIDDLVKLMPYLYSDVPNSPKRKAQISYRLHSCTNGKVSNIPVEEMCVMIRSACAATCIQMEQGCDVVFIGHCEQGPMLTMYRRECCPAESPVNSCCCESGDL